MAFELVYTSAARGLRSEGGGFCTVAMSRGMPPALVPRLESLSGYRPGPSGDGPVAHCFFRLESPAGTANVLAVVAPAPPDHTARSNKVAGFLVLGADELRPAGPAWLVAQPGLVRRGWSGAPAWIERPAEIPDAPEPGLRRCEAWERAAGDAGWAGTVASGFLRDQARPVHVVYGPGVDALELVAEVLRLLPAWARWRATFSTYFIQPVAGVPCILRFCLDGTPAAESARGAKGLVVDLTKRLPPATDSRFVRMARSGVHEPETAEQPPSVGAAELDLESLRQAAGPRQPQPARADDTDVRAAEAARARAERQRAREEAADEGPDVARVAIVAGAVACIALVAVLVLRSGGGTPPGAPSSDPTAASDAAPPDEPPPAAQQPPFDPLPPPASPPAPQSMAARSTPASASTVAVPAPPAAPSGTTPSGAGSTPTPAPPVPTAPSAAESAPAAPAPPAPASPSVPSAIVLDPAVFDWKVDARLGDLEASPRPVFSAPAAVESLRVDLGRPSGIAARTERGTVAMVTTGTGRGITLGSFSWAGREVRWSWKRIDMRANDAAIRALRDALGTARIEATLADGSATRCEAPPAAVVVSPPIGGSASCAVPCPPGVDPVIVGASSGAWAVSPRSTPAELVLEGAAGEFRIAWSATAREVRAAWACGEHQELVSARIESRSASQELNQLTAASSGEHAPPDAAAPSARERESRRAAVARRVTDASQRVARLEDAVRTRERSASPAIVEVRTAEGRVLARVEVTPGAANGRKER
jgi:hypothetical protein